MLFTLKMLSGKRMKYQYFKDFTSFVLISNMMLLILLFGIKLLAQLNIFKNKVYK